MKTKGAQYRCVRDTFKTYSFLKRDCKPIKKLNNGYIGSSNIALYRPKNTQIILKQILFNNIEVERMKHLSKEVVLLMRTPSRYIAPPIGIIVNNPFTIAMEEATGGSLYDAINQQQLSPTDKTLITIGVAYGMRRLHKMQKIHGDLKTTNILLTENKTPLISDFGLNPILEQINANTIYQSKSLYWQAPEYFVNRRSSKEADVYSFGIMLYELYVETQPFTDMTLEQIYKIQHNPATRLKMPDSAPPMLRALFRACTNANPKKRPSFIRIYRLFKTGQAAFENTDRERIEFEVSQIKADRHKSVERLRTINGKPPPTRAQLDPKSPIPASSSPRENQKNFLRLPQTKAHVRPKGQRLPQKQNSQPARVFSSTRAFDRAPLIDLVRVYKSQNAINVYKPREQPRQKSPPERHVPRNLSLKSPTVAPITNKLIPLLRQSRMPLKNSVIVHA